VVDIIIEGELDEETQFVLDYGDLDVFLKPLIEQVDHRHLNTFIQYPSAENICIYFADKVTDALRLHCAWALHRDYQRLCVSVSETPKTSAHWDSHSDYDLRLLTFGTGWKAPTSPYIVACQANDVTRQNVVMRDAGIINEQRALATEALATYTAALINIQFLESLVLKK
jgi:6-pyruvoyl-tetrahydropterin synthase